MAPDVLYFAGLGLGLWGAGLTGRREVQPAVLAAVLLVTCCGTSAKVGSDLNYYLGLRAVEALAVGALWHAWRIAPTRLRSASLGLAASLGCLLTLPGGYCALMNAQIADGKARFFAGPRGRQVLGFYEDIGRVAANPQSRFLTDSSYLDMHQEARGRVR